MPRVLFYCTLVFALLIHQHLWLVAGALGAALTYSGVAAIHACLFVWTGLSWGDFDRDALMAILSTSCLMVVPMLNWSKTLRNHEARTIVVYWGCLITVGFISLFYLIVWGSSWTEISVDVTTISCAPGTNGTGVQYIGPSYVQEHNCTNPCSTPPFHTIFRRTSDLILISNETFYDLYGESANKHKAREVNFYYSFTFWSDFLFPYIILQGIWASCFGRRRPFEVRDEVFIFWNRLKIPHFQGKVAKLWQQRIAKVWALFSYLAAVFVAFVCVPLFILNLFAYEFALAIRPVSEAFPLVGQWSPWAATCLVFLAALIAHYHDRMIDTSVWIMNIYLARLRRWRETRSKNSIKNARQEHDRSISSVDQDPEGRTGLGIDRQASHSQEPLPTRPPGNHRKPSKPVVVFDQEWQRTGYEGADVHILETLEASAKSKTKTAWTLLKFPFVTLYARIRLELTNFRLFWKNPVLIARKTQGRLVSPRDGIKALAGGSRVFGFSTLGYPVVRYQRTDQEVQEIYLEEEPMVDFELKEEPEAMESNHRLRESVHENPEFHHEREEHLNMSLLPGAGTVKAVAERIGLYPNTNFESSTPVPSLSSDGAEGTRGQWQRTDSRAGLIDPTSESQRYTDTRSTFVPSRMSSASTTLVPRSPEVAAAATPLASGLVQNPTIDTARASEQAAQLIRGIKIHLTDAAISGSENPPETIVLVRGEDGVYRDW